MIKVSWDQGFKRVYRKKVKNDAKLKGLPPVIEFCRAGFAVTGFDVDEQKVSLLQQGKSYIKESSTSRKMRAGIMKKKIEQIVGELKNRISEKYGIKEMRVFGSNIQEYLRHPKCKT